MKNTKDPADAADAEPVATPINRPAMDSAPSEGHGPPDPVATESETTADGSGAVDGSSALTRAIDEYLELAASALTNAAEETDDPDAEGDREGGGNAPSLSSHPSLPGMIPDSKAGGSNLEAVSGAPAAATGLPETGPPVPQFRPNVTAFWIPSMADGLSSAQAAAKEAASRVADAIPVVAKGGGGPASGPIVVVTGSSPSSAGHHPVSGAVSDGVKLDGATPSTATGPTRPSGSHPVINAPAPFRVGNYEVATRIAQGGMGSIYVCRRTGEAGFQRLFTLKVVRQHSAQREEAVQSFKREAHVGSMLSHPNLQTVLDVGSYRDQPFLILDYVEGTSLSELMSDERRAPVPVVIAILLDVLRGLHHAHQLVDDKGKRLGLVHGDVSPQNVLVGVDGASRLTDFGSATFTGEGRLHDPKWKATGKPAYMAPEQLRAETLDARTDVFAVGVLMWSALTSQKLFAGDTYDETIIKVLRKKIAPPSAYDAPACLDDICLKALSRSREGRFATADEMARDLLRTAANENLLASPADVGNWVRRESGEALGEQRRRIHLMFATAKAPAGRTPTPGGIPTVGSNRGAKPPVRGPATVVLDHVQRSPHTPQVGATKTLPSRTAFLPASRPRAGTFWRNWNVVIVSALLALPITLTIGYFASNLLVPAAPPRKAPVPQRATVADAGPPGG